MTHLKCSAANPFTSHDYPLFRKFEGTILSEVDRLSTNRVNFSCYSMYDKKKSFYLFTF